MAYLNLVSLVLGIVSLGLPLIALQRRERDLLWYHIGSLSACGIALLMQMMYTYHLVSIADWSALADTNGAVSSLASLLLILTILLNIGAHFLWIKQNRKLRFIKR